MMQESMIHSFVIRYQTTQYKGQSLVKVRVTNVFKDDDTYFESLEDAYLYMKRIVQKHIE
ncbi:hypothetical protein [Alkalibacillus aidingensis]|uniref:hypothetical protein n=1 Tax=Alkalibacillus aidingensis TaxID=2747607 RepID=UPI0016607B29|nr:hypothetical protein [Alkalibacillus aidingensis]